jgi:hypothetical protein
VGSANWRRYEPDPKARPLPGRFALTAAYGDLMIAGVGNDVDGVATDVVAIARSIAWTRHAPVSSAREIRQGGRVRVDLFAISPAPAQVRAQWEAFQRNEAVGEALIMRTPASVSVGFTGSTDHVPEGTPIPGAGVAEIYVRFRDWLVYYQPCKTGMVATARVAAWLSRR